VLAVLGLMLAVCAAGRGLPAHAEGITVSYSTGWNLVSGPAGSRLVGASGAMYSLQPGDTDYESFPVDAPLKAGRGYLAYFPSGGILTPATDQSSYSVTLQPGQWAMLGNPSASGAATVTGAVGLLTFTPSGGYQAGTEIAAGQGAWVQAHGAVKLTVKVGAPRPLPPAPYAAGGGLAPSQDTIANAMASAIIDLAIDGSRTPSLPNLQPVSGPGGYRFQIPADWKRNDPSGTDLGFVGPDPRQAVYVVVGTSDAGTSADAACKAFQGQLKVLHPNGLTDAGVTASAIGGAPRVAGADSAALCLLGYAGPSGTIYIDYILVALQGQKEVVLVEDITADFGTPSSVPASLTVVALQRPVERAIRLSFALAAP
jgi:hypothetical protein